MAKTWLKGIGAAVAVVAVLSLAPATMAQGPGTRSGTGTAPTGTTQQQGTGEQRGPGRRGGGPIPLPLVAETIGITVEELRAELDAGQTIAQVAQANGMTLEALVEALLEPKAEHLAQLVEDGTLTQAQADAKLAEQRTKLTAQLQQSGQAGGGRPGRPGGGGGRPPRPTATPTS